MLMQAAAAQPVRGGLGSPSFGNHPPVSRHAGGGRVTAGCGAGAATARGRTGRAAMAVRYEQALSWREIA